MNAVTALTTDMLLLAMLVWVRVTAALVASPVFGTVPAPVAFKTLLLLFFSLALAGAMLPHPDARAALPQPGAWRAHLPALFLTEAFIGLTLGFGLQAAFGALSIAGKVLDIQIGFGMGATYDPVMRAPVPVLATALTLYAVVIFFAVGAHHGVLRGLAFSFERMPAGAGTLSAQALPAVVAQFGAMFSLAVVVVAPVIVGLLLVDAGLAVLSRVMPQMNIMFVGVPVKVFAGLALLALLAPHLRVPLARAMHGVLAYFERVAP
jgi:flagellar biosynthetic protein FliR